jgi:hypothetical protein
MKRVLIIILCLVLVLVLIVGCNQEVKEEVEILIDYIGEHDIVPGPSVVDNKEELNDLVVSKKNEGNYADHEELERDLRNEDVIQKQQKRFRLEIPTESERETLPSCDNILFTSYPVDINEVTSITPLGNIGPPGHTFPTQHPHLHMGKHGNGGSFDVFTPADVYLTMVSWSKGASSDPIDYVVYFALCKDVVAYYNHVKTISPELNTVVNKYGCEDFSAGESSCTKVLDLDKFEEGKLIGTVGLKQGNWDFGLIDLRKPLNFIKPLRQPERDRFLQCAFDYYPQEMRNKLYSLINRDDGTCGEVMQDVAGTLKGDWYHESAGEEYVTDWDVFLAFINDWQFSKAQVVSIAGKFTGPSKYQFNPKTSGTINRDFADVTFDGKIYCYQGENIGRSFDSIPSGKIVVKMVNKETLHIEHQSGSCSGSENIIEPTVYKR